MKQKIFDQQIEFQKMIGAPIEFISPHTRIEACNIQVRRAVDELFEALREMPYDLSGFTKSKKAMNFKALLMANELVDAQLFLINALNIMGISYEDFTHLCTIKQDENVKRFIDKKRFRQDQDDFLIVIEGPDGVGKSTICKLLSDRTGIPIMRMPEPPRENIEQFSQFYRRTVANIDGVMILDRFFPSSMVYGSYFKRDTPLDDIVKLSKKREIFTFIIDTDVPFRGDEFINEDQWPEIRNTYLSLAKTNKWEIIKNDSTLEDCVQRILEKLRY